MFCFYGILKETQAHKWSLDSTRISNTQIGLQELHGVESMTIKGLYYCTFQKNENSELESSTNECFFFFLSAANHNDIEP